MCEFAFCAARARGAKLLHPRGFLRRNAAGKPVIRTNCNENEMLKDLLDSALVSSSSLGFGASSIYWMASYNMAVVL